MESMKGIKSDDVFRLIHVLRLKVDYKLKSSNHVMVQAVNRRPVPAKTCFDPWVAHTCRIFVYRKAQRQLFFSITLSIIQHRRCVFLATDNTSLIDYVKNNQILRWRKSLCVLFWFVGRPIHRLCTKKDPLKFRYLSTNPYGITNKKAVILTLNYFSLLLPPVLHFSPLFHVKCFRTYFSVYNDTVSALWIVGLLMALWEKTND